MTQQFANDAAVADNMILKDLIGLIESGIPFTLLDVREPHEWQSGHLEGAQLLPLGELLNNSAAVSNMSKAIPMVVYCQHGIRSFRAVRYLREQGFDAFNLLVDWASLD